MLRTVCAVKGGGKLEGQMGKRDDRDPTLVAVGQWQDKHRQAGLASPELAPAGGHGRLTQLDRWRMLVVDVDVRGRNFPCMNGFVSRTDPVHSPVERLASLCTWALRSQQSPKLAVSF